MTLRISFITKQFFYFSDKKIRICVLSKINPLSVQEYLYNKINNKL